MTKKEAKQIFKKYIRNECSQREINLLHAYLESYQANTNKIHEMEWKNDLKDRTWAEIQFKLRQDKKRKRYLKSHWFRYAAIFLLLVSGFFGFYLSQSVEVPDGTTDSVGPQVLLKKSGKSTTTVSDSEEALIFGSNGAIVGKKTGTTFFSEKENTEKEIKFNEIIIPNGRSFKVILADGTVVHLNSGSKLKFPEVFRNDRPREVLLEGEGFFEVAKKGGNPFLVRTDNMEIKVLGTQFNVSSYSKGPTFTVLVEGGIEVKKTDALEGESGLKLFPGEMATLTSNEVQVTKVDTKDYIGWMDGILQFENEPFGNIVLKIERKFNITVQNNCPELESARFTGKFTEESLLEVLDVFKEIAQFNYIKTENKIVIE